MIGAKFSCGTCLCLKSKFQRSFCFNYLYVLAKSLQLCLTLRHHGLWPTRLLCPWNSPSKNTSLGGHALFQGIFLIQGSSPSLLCLLHWQVCSLPLMPPEDHLFVCMYRKITWRREWLSTPVLWPGEFHGHVSGILWPLLIPEYSGIKRRGMPFPELRNPGISFVSFLVSHHGDKYPLLSLIGIPLCLVSLEF